MPSDKLMQALLSPSVWGTVSALSYALVGTYVLVAPGGVLLRGSWLLIVLVAIGWGVAIAQPGALQLGGDTTLLGFALSLAVPTSWYLAIHRLLRGPYRQSMPNVVRRLLRLFWVVAAVVAMAALWLVSASAGPWGNTLLFAIVLAIVLVTLALVAQLSGDAPVEGATALRWLVAAGVLSAASHLVIAAVGALGFGIASEYLAGVAISQAVAALLLLLALRQRPQWSLAISISRQAQSYTPRFLAVAGSLLAFLVLLPLARAVDPTAPEPLALMVCAVVAMPLGLFLFSERLNARLRVQVGKHLLPFRYDYREEWLRLIDTLVSPDIRAPLPERVVKAVAQIVGSPGGVLWMRHRDAEGYSCVASWNTKIWVDGRVHKDDPALRFMLQRERQWIIDTAELTRRPELYGGLRRPDWLEPFPDALLIVPLISNEQMIGFLVLLQASSAFRLTFEEIDLLRTSGRQVAAFLAQYESDQRLAEARQFEAFNRLTAFVMHDLKNLIAQQSLMVANAAKFKGNPEFFEDAIATIENSVARMSKLLQQLQSGESSGPQQRVRLAAVARDAVDRCATRPPVPTLVDGAPDASVWIDRDRLTTILAHLIRNAQEATSADGHVTVAVSGDEGGAVVSIEDDGCGMDAEFVRTRLFRPFDTTKGSKGMGIGAYQARTFVTDAGGRLLVDSVPGKGTRITLWLPTDTGRSETSGA